MGYSDERLAGGTSRPASVRINALVHQAMVPGLVVGGGRPTVHSRQMRRGAPRAKDGGVFDRTGRSAHAVARRRPRPFRNATTVLSTRSLSRLFVAACLAVSSVDALLAAGSSGRGVAASLFESQQSLVYQIRVIDTVSGDKVSIGSGFRVSPDGVVATNFHVVAAFVHEPEKYRLEYVTRDGASGGLALSAVDVVHDLALVRADLPGERALELATAPLSQGDRIYSMGNPQDLGMTIIEGTYNGLVSVSRYEKILFSGSLNPGMSGGPTMTADGTVMGVNVSKGGEQISFLVPAKYLAALIERASRDPRAVDSSRSIRDAVFADQAEFYRAMLSAPLETARYGAFELPERITPAVKCWGHSDEGAEAERYRRSRRHCATEDVIYIDEGFVTGELYYDYEWMTSGELNVFQFYSAVASRYRHRPHQNTFDTEDVGGYECVDDFIEVAGHTFKASSCQRAYLEYPGLYDLSFVMTSVDMSDRALILRIGATGIGRREAVLLLRRFLEAIR